jgi:hypothetical protein
MPASVTVSIAAETSGAQTLMFREKVVATCTSRGSTADFAGTSNTSSKVSPSVKTLSLVKVISNYFYSAKVTIIYCINRISFELYAKKTIVSSSILFYKTVFFVKKSSLETSFSPNFYNKTTSVEGNPHKILPHYLIVRLFFYGLFADKI